MDNRKKGILVGIAFAVYSVIVSLVVLPSAGNSGQKPLGWEMWPTSWQRDWTPSSTGGPNFILYVVLILVGALATFAVYRVLKKK